LQIKGAVGPFDVRVFAHFVISKDFRGVKSSTNLRAVPDPTYSVRLDAELLPDAAQVQVHRRLRDKQRLCDLAHRHPLDDQRRDLGLARRQLRDEVFRQFWQDPEYFVRLRGHHFRLNYAMFPLTA